MYKCYTCNKEYESSNDRDKCTLSHDIVYIELTKEELNRLVNFVMSGEPKLLTETLVRKLMKYLKNSKK